MAAVFRAAALSLLASQIQPCTAHMQMDWPFPLRSSFDPAVPESLKDYDMASPLKNDGSNFPCKLYQNNATNPQAYDIKAVYEAGGTYNISLTGGASHLGGSCQISLSYDNGATFKVIESIIGGCPLSPNYFFTVPEFAPSSDTVLLSWSWFNLIGNRDMYQNCARVQVVGGSLPATSNRRRDVKYRSRRQTSLASLPDMFECNIGNGCKTIEKREVVFPDPGSMVLYGQDATTPDPGPGFTLDNNGNTATSTTTSASASVTFAPFPAINTTASTTTFSAISTTQSTTPVFQNTTFVTQGGVFASVSSTLSSVGSATGSSSTLATSSSLVPSTMVTSVTTSNSSSASSTTSTPVSSNVTSTGIFSNTTSASSSVTTSLLSTTTSSSVLNTTTSASSSTSTGGGVSSTTTSSPTVVTVTITVTATPLTSGSVTTPFPSLAEVLTIVPISELSVLQSLATASSVASS